MPAEAEWQKILACRCGDPWFHIMASLVQFLLVGDCSVRAFQSHLFHRVGFYFKSSYQMLSVLSNSKRVMYDSQPVCKPMSVVNLASMTKNCTRNFEN